MQYLFFFSATSFAMLVASWTNFYSFNKEENNTMATSLPSELIQLANCLGNTQPMTQWEDARTFFKKFGRNSGIERWQMTPLYFELKTQTIIDTHLKNLGFFDAIPPKQNTYDYAIVLGATVGTMLARLRYLVDQWNLGLRFQHLVFFTGSRQIEAHELTEDVVNALAQYKVACALNIPTNIEEVNTETEAAYFFILSYISSYSIVSTGCDSNACACFFIS